MVEKMRNIDFIRAVAKRTDYAMKDIKAVMNAIEAELVEQIADGKAVRALPSITFSVQERAEHAGHNPQNSAPITIPACKMWKVKFSKGIKDAIN